MKKILGLITLTCLCFQTITAQNAAGIYLLYDNQCMHQYEYRSENSKEDRDYYDYHITVSETEDFVLTVPNNPKNQVLQKELKLSLLTCGMMDYKEIIPQLKNGQKVFVVQPVEKGYYVSEVSKMGAYEYNDAYFSYKSTDSHFSFRYAKAYNKGEDLTEGTNSDFYLYQYTGNVETMKDYVFKKIPKGPYFASEVHYLPSIGLYEERFKDYNISLKSIDYAPIGQHKRAFLAQNVQTYNQENEVKSPIGTNAENFSSYIETSVGANVIGGNKATATKPGVNIPTSIPTEMNIAMTNQHVVMKGNTLYNLSKRYKTTVEKLQQLNRMQGSTNIEIGQRLRVK